jgi:hypothetical protein
MIALGFVTLYANQERAYATEIAKRAQTYNIQFYRFTPISIDPMSEYVHGEIYNSQTDSWEKAEFEIPTFLYDRCFYGNDEHSKKCQPIMNWLKNRPDCIFLGHGLPNKWDIHNALIQDKLLSPYIPTTEQATSTTVILHTLMKIHKIILKPEKGSMGRGIVGLVLHRSYAEAIYKENGQLQTTQFATRGDLKNWLRETILTQAYLMQPYLPLHDENDRPFDIRILLQKDSKGKWIEQGRGIRRGFVDHIISNIDGGGEIISFEDWSERLSDNQKLLLQDNIHTLTTRLPFILEEQFSPLFELGIDVGVTKDGALWLLDTNSKPGRKVLLQTSSDEKKEDLYTAPLQYCFYLHSQLSGLKRS